MLTESSSVKKYPLTSYQRDIFIEQLIHEEKALYTVGGILWIYGDINYDLFRKSINQIIKNHDTLRIRLRDEQGEPRQFFAEIESISHGFKIMLSLIKIPVMSSKIDLIFI